MINKNTLLKDYRVLVSQMFDEHCSKNKVTRPDNCAGFNPIDNAIKNNDKITIGEFLKLSTTDPDRDSTIFLSLVYIYKEIDEETINLFIDSIQDPITALHVYMKNASLSKNKEDKLLGKIKDRLPTVEKELVEGKVKRV